MGLGTTRDADDFAGQLADHARKLQTEARAALEQGDYTRASALIGDAELLAEDVHDLVSHIERREIGGLMTLAAYDVRANLPPVPPSTPMPFKPPSRKLRVALAATIALGLALVEY